MVFLDGEGEWGSGLESGIRSLRCGFCHSGSCRPLSAVRGPVSWGGDPGLASGVREFQYTLIFCSVLPGGIGFHFGVAAWVLAVRSKHFRDFLKIP